MRTLTLPYADDLLLTSGQASEALEAELRFLLVESLHQGRLEQSRNCRWAYRVPTNPSAICVANCKKSHFESMSRGDIVN